MKTIRLSTNWTLVLKIFLPIVWLSFFFSFFLSTFLANPVEVPQIANNGFRVGISIFIISGIAFFAFTFFRLMRVDADANHVYVSNYFKTYRYTVDSIDYFKEYDHLILKAIHIHLKDKGRFGKRIIFIPKRKHFDIFISENKLENKLFNADKQESNK